ncbi:MAG: response regulator [Deltaproteobacteria bacterium]|nr:response regulator [Deltaproteobacteria bacterium]
MMGHDKKRILVIEDDEEMRALLKDFFLEEGLETDSVSNGSEAFRKLVKESFVLVITDIRMPGLTGLDILPGIRKLQPEVPIIVITAFGSEEIRQRALERGATAYLEKPVHFYTLRSLVCEMVYPPSTPLSPEGRS